MTKALVRKIFVAGSILFIILFAFLTVDTLRQMPARTNEQNLTAQVIAGKALWQSHDCTGCHTLLGNGAYFAPDLTIVTDQRGSDFVHVWLIKPAGQMPSQHLTANEAADLVAFLSWTSQIDTNGWPPKPLVAVAPSGSTAQGANLFQSRGCAGCHGAQGQGTAAAPGLLGITQRLDTAYLTRWLIDPAGIKPGTTMPDLGLSTTDADALVTFLATLGG